MEIINLKCPSCAGALEVTSDMDRFACGYCGSEQMVVRQGGTVSLKLVTDAISRVQVGTDKTAAELALKRLEGEIRNAEDACRRLSEKHAGEIQVYHIFGIIAAAMVFFTGLLIGVASMTSAANTASGIAVLTIFTGGAAVIAILILFYGNKYLQTKVKSPMEAKQLEYDMKLYDLKKERDRNLYIVNS